MKKYKEVPRITQMGDVDECHSLERSLNDEAGIQNH